MLCLETVVNSIRKRKDTPFTWVRDEPTEDDLQHIIKEGVETPSEFDPLHLRKQVIDDLVSGKAKLVTKRGPYAKVLAIVYSDTVVPWNTFADIFKAFGEPAKGKPLWRIVWFAHPKKREFPFPETKSAPYNILPKNVNASFHLKNQVQPLHINGGYAYPCQPETIVIYREEEVCRVLVHELLHAACTDNMKHPEWMREVLTETWAEIFLIAILAKGSLGKARKLWKIQAQWIADQESVLKGVYGILGPESYAWRYTVGRRQALMRLGMEIPTGVPDSFPNSLRFTSPALV
jgi:hypothetical protein